MTTNEVSEVLIKCANNKCEQCDFVGYGAPKCQDELIKVMGAELRKIGEQNNVN